MNAHMHIHATRNTHAHTHAHTHIHNTHTHTQTPTHAHTPMYTHTHTSTFLVVYRGSGVNHRVTKLQQNTLYTFRIAASSVSGQGAWSDHMTSVTTPTPPLPPPSGEYTSQCVPASSMGTQVADDIQSKSYLTDLQASVNGPPCRSNCEAGVGRGDCCIVRECGVPTPPDL